MIAPLLLIAALQAPAQEPTLPQMLPDIALRLRELEGCREALKQAETDVSEQRGLCEQIQAAYRTLTAAQEMTIAAQREALAAKEATIEAYKQRIETLEFDRAQRKKGGGFFCKLGRVLTLGLSRPCL